MVFRANSMTFKIDPELWNSLPNYRLKSEFEEFLRWFGSNVAAIDEKDASAGWLLLCQLKGVMEERGMDTTEYMHLNSAARGDAQISLFPTA